MPVYFAAPEFSRAGVVAGFVLSAPDYSGTPPGVGRSISYTFRATNWTNGIIVLHFETGYQHWVVVGPATFGYMQRAGDTGDTVAAALANLVNGAADPLVTATSAGATLTLTPRQNTGAAIVCSASPSSSTALPNTIMPQTMWELNGDELVPAISQGILFAQGTMYAPAAAPVLPAAPNGRQSWLYYSSATGWYWGATPTPTTSDDACVGWVVTSGGSVIALSSRKIGVGPEAAIIPGGPVSAGIGSSGIDTSVPPAPTFQAAETNAQLTIGDLDFASADNTDGIDFASFILYYVDESVGTTNVLTAPLAPGATSMSAWHVLPASTPGSVTFTFMASGSVGPITIGPGYVHSIGIGALTYTYEQQVADTAALVATGLANAINAAADPNAMATAAGGTVVLTALQNTSARVTCSASDGNAPAPLMEYLPSYVVIDEEIIEVVNDPYGSTIVRGVKGSTMSTHAAGAKIWPVTAMTVVFALPQFTFGTAAWPTVIGQIPWGARSLVAADCWVANEIGPSPVTTECFTGAGPFAVDSLGNPLAPNVTGLTASAALGTDTFVASGQFNPPTLDAAAYANLMQVWVRITDHTTQALIAPDVVLTQPLATPHQTYQFPAIPLDMGGIRYYDVMAWAVNGDGELSAGAPSVTLTVAAPQVTAVTGRQVPGSLIADPVTRLVSTTIGGTPTFLGNVVPQNASYWISQDGGATFVWLGWKLVLTVGYEIQFRRVSPTTTGSWVIAMAAGTIGGDPTIWIPAASLPSGAVLSAAFAVAALTVPLATDIPALTVAAGAGGNHPYNTQTAGGDQFFWLGDMGYNDTGATADPQAFFVRITAQDVDATHTPIGPEQACTGTQVSLSGAAQTFTGPAGEYLTHGYGYERSGNIAYVRLRAYVCNRVDQTTNSFQDAACATLQTGVGSGAGYIDVLVASAGNPPPGALVLADASPASLGPSLAVVGLPAGTGSVYSLAQGFPKLTLNSLNITTSALADPSFYSIGYGVQQGVFPAAITSALNGQWAWQTFVLMSGGSITINTNAGADDSFSARLTGGPMAGLQQVISVTPGNSINLSCMVCSNNPSLGGGHHELYFSVRFYNAGMAYLYGADAATVVGYVSNWTQAAGYAPVPAGAAYALISVSTANDEPPAGYFDVDAFQVQHVLNQSGSGQNASMAPASGPINASALTVHSTADGSSSQYGQGFTEYTTSDGSTVQILALTGGALQVNMQNYQGATIGVSLNGNNAVVQLTAGGGAGRNIYLEALPGGSFVDIDGSSGTTETLAAAFAAGRHVKGGVIVP
jgi:hypothetical protein